MQYRSYTGIINITKQAVIELIKLKFNGAVRSILVSRDQLLDILFTQKWKRIARIVFYKLSSAKVHPRQKPHKCAPKGPLYK